MTLVDTILWVSCAVNVASAIVSVRRTRISRRWDRDMKAELIRLETVPDGAAASAVFWRKIHEMVMDALVKDTEQFDAIFNDLRFLHDVAYETMLHPSDCPICRDMVKLTAFIESLSNAREKLHIEGDVACE